MAKFCPRSNDHEQSQQKTHQVLVGFAGPHTSNMESQQEPFGFCMRLWFYLIFCVSLRRLDVSKKENKGQRLKPQGVFYCATIGVKKM